MAVVAVLAVLAQGGIFLNRALKNIQYEIRQAELRKQFNVSVHEDFLDESDSLLHDLQNDALWKACDTITASGTVRLWYYPGKEPANLFERVVVRIYKDTPYWEKAASFEYWCNIIDIHASGEATDHPWHTDRDEDILERERKLVTPLMGAVYYGYNETYDGGDFHMVATVPYRRDSREPAEGDQCAKDLCVSQPHLLSDDESAMFVKTRFNTLLFANVTHFHKVTPVFSGRRYSLAVNADHWMPFDPRDSMTNEELLSVASAGVEQNRRTFGLV